MKNLFTKIFAVIAVVGLASCEEVDNAIYDVQDGVTRGAAIRTLEVVSGDFNVFDPSSAWEIVVEEQDEEFGGLLSEINVYASYTDALDSGASVAESMIGSVSASEMTTSANGLPSTTLRYELGEVASLIGASYTGGSYFTFRLEAVLTDGRTFSADDASGSMQGSFFSSPYAYKSTILCIPDMALPGTYTINMQDSYGDGWNGGFIQANMDGTTVDVTLDSGSSGSATVDVPAGTTSLVFTWNKGSWDSEVTFQILGPNNGSTIASGGPSPAVGEIALNLCFE